MVKVYIALFTCAVMCAIHLGFVENCSDQEFLSAFRRFISVRSVSKLIVSHNAKTSEALNRTLIDMYNIIVGLKILRTALVIGPLLYLPVHQN